MKLKLQYSDHLIRRANSLKKTLMLGKTEGGRRRGYRGWDSWMASLTIKSLSKLRDREAWHAAVHRVANSQIQLSYWTNSGPVGLVCMLFSCLPLFAIHWVYTLLTVADSGKGVKADKYFKLIIVIWKEPVSHRNSGVSCTVPACISSCRSRADPRRTAYAGTAKCTSKTTALRFVTQPGLILCNPVTCRLPGSVHGDSSGKILEWVTMPSSH